MLTSVLVTAAFVAGLTGTWSPCGFSMIETIGSPRRHVPFSCAMFGAGACAGGVATFGLLGALGSRLSSLVATLLAVVIASGAVLADARGAGISPQVRHQVPEHWRRRLPLPFAAWLYGVLLGLGFTTYVLTFAVWGLAVLVFAAGEPGVGVAAGLSFGIGRALPIVLIAPFVYRPVGINALAALAERPALLRRVRVVDATVLALAAATVLAGSARGASNLGPGTDPSVSGDLLAWSTPPGGGVLLRGGTRTELPGRPALGGSLVAWRSGAAVHVATADGLAPVLDLTLASVDALGVSDRWLVTRERGAVGADVLVARSLQAPDAARVVATVRPPAQIGRPSLDGDLVVFHVSAVRSSRIVAADLAAGTSRVVRSTATAQLANPSVLGDQLLYVRLTAIEQRLELGRLAPGGPSRVLYRLSAPARRDPGYEPGHSNVTRTPRPKLAPGTLWTTALAPQIAYVTFIRRKDGAASILSVRR